MLSFFGIRIILIHSIFLYPIFIALDLKILHNYQNYPSASPLLQSLKVAILYKNLNPCYKILNTFSDIY